MKRLLASLLLIVTLAAALVSCSSRTGKDISGAKNLADLKGATIAAQTGTFHLDALKAQGDGITVKEYKDFPALLTALKAGAIDGYVAEAPTAYAECAKDSSLGYIALKNNDTGFTAGDDDTGVSVGFKKGSELLAKVNAILANVSEESKTTLMKQIVDIGVDKDKELQTIFAIKSDKTDTSNGTLKISMECGYDPFNWTQMTNANGAVLISGTTNQYANGYDVQIAKYIAAELGMELVIVKNEWDSLIPAVQSGAVDGIIAGMSPTAERKAEIDFSDCYYRSDLVIIYKKSAENK